MRKPILMCVLAMSMGACSKKEEVPPNTGQHFPLPSGGVEPAAAPAPKADTGITDCSFPSFSLAYSEYASWSTFAVAEMQQLVGAEKGKCGPIERKHGVDIELRFMGYGPSIGAYAGGTADSVTITHLDMLTAQRSDTSVVVTATSNSWGADRTIVPNGVTVDSLAGKPCRGLEATVSQYVFEETLLKKHVNDLKRYPYQNMEPDAAAAAMKARDANIGCIAVWEPFALDAITARGDVHVIADSRLIPAEILDTIVVGQAALDRPKGDAFVAALLDTFYAIVRDLENPATSDDAHRRLGKKVTDLDAAAMRDVLTRSVLYRKPEWVVELLSNGNPYPFPDGTKGMPLKDSTAKSVAWMLAHKAITAAPTIGYGSKAQAPGTNFRFDPTYVQAYIASGGN